MLHLFVYFYIHGYIGFSLHRKEMINMKQTQLLRSKQQVNQLSQPTKLERLAQVVVLFLNIHVANGRGEQLQNLKSSSVKNILISNIYSTVLNI